MNMHRTKFETSKLTHSRFATNALTDYAMNFFSEQEI